MNRLLGYITLPRVLPLARVPSRRWAALGIMLVIAACNERQPIADYIAEERAKSGPAPELLSTVVPYQAPIYNQGTKNSPFLLMPEPLTAKAPVVDVQSSPNLNCDQEQQDRFIAVNWSLRATFSNHNKSIALIHIPTRGTQTATVGQRLDLSAGLAKEAHQGSEEPAPEDRVDVAAIHSQSVTLKHQRIYTPECTKTQMVTLNLYD